MRRWVSASVSIRRRASAGQDVLYRTLDTHLERFLENLGFGERPLASHVSTELRAYLRCGIPEYGFTWLQCGGCKDNLILPFSCKGRGFCPTCGGRRMNQTAANLLDHVIPRVPVRQWVLSLPMPLRLWVSWRPDLCQEVRAIFLRTVQSFYRHHGRKSGLEQPQTGAVCYTQRFGSSLNLNVHFHALVLDGVYEASDNGVRFHSHPSMSTVDVQRVVSTVRRRVERHLRRKGWLDEDRAPDCESVEALFALQSAAMSHRVAMGPRAGHRLRRRCLGEARTFRLPPLCAEDDWFSLHAGVRIPASNRDGLERLCRYIARPPLSHDRLRKREDGLLELRLKTPWRDGTTHLVLSPHELLEKLAAIIPPPRVNLVTYHGILAPAAKHRAAVVPASAPENKKCRHSHRSSGWMDWAELMKRVFRKDVLKCERCQGTLTVKVVVKDWISSGRLLTALESNRARDGPAVAAK